MLFLPKMGDAGGKTWQNHLKECTIIQEKHTYLSLFLLDCYRTFLNARVQCCIIRIYQMSFSESLELEMFGTCWVFFLNRGRLYKVQGFSIKFKSHWKEVKIQSLFPRHQPDWTDWVGFLCCTQHQLQLYTGSMPWGSHFGFYSDGLGDHVLIVGGSALPRWRQVGSIASTPKNAALHVGTSWSSCLVSWSTISVNYPLVN